MKDIPIIFSAPMVRALLDGRKTMTRRLAWKVAPVWSSGGVIRDGAGGQMDYVEPHWVEEGKASPWQRVKPGDRLWVRENFYVEGGHEGNNFGYAADIPDNEGPPKLVPSIHMPRHLSRLTLVVTATKIERLQNISEEDATAEGAQWHDGHGVGHSGFRHDPNDGCVWARPSESFGRLWIRLYGDDAWWANPEVIALTFTVHKTNIDQLKEVA